MVRKKAEGDESQRRAAARNMRREGAVPGGESVTTGASKQRTHLRSRLSGLPVRLRNLRRGKQRRGAEQAAGAAPAAEAPLSFTGRGRHGYSEAHETVYRAVVEAMHQEHGQPVFLDEVVRFAGMPTDEVRAILHDLAEEHGLVTVLAGDTEPDLGPRYETSPRR